MVLSCDIVVESSSQERARRAVSGPVKAEGGASLASLLRLSAQPLGRCGGNFKPRAMACAALRGARQAPKPFSGDSFDLQMTLLALCKCLHESGQVPASRLAIELHKVRFSTMKQLHPSNTECSFQRAMRSERILTQCVEYADRFLAIELFNTCKVLAKGLKSNPQLLPGVHLALGPQMWEWHPQPGTLRLLGDCIPRTQTFRSTLAQQRDVVVTCGGHMLSLPKHSWQLGSRVGDWSGSACKVSRPHGRTRQAN